MQSNNSFSSLLQLSLITFRRFIPNAGLLEKTPEGIVFPYDAVHVDFMLEAA